MPSTTTYYGWTYPISSDDLNAGATSVGSLATGIDSTVKTLANLVQNLDATKLEAVTFSTTTSSVGTLNFSGYPGFAGIGQVRKMSGGALLSLNQSNGEFWILQTATNSYISPMWAFTTYASQAVTVTLLLTT